MFVQAAVHTDNRPNTVEYVHTLRLEEAKRLLETTDFAIDPVANGVGYEDSSFFRRLFRRKVGLSPHAYRLRFSAFGRALADSSVRQLPDGA